MPKICRLHNSLYLKIAYQQDMNFNTISLLFPTGFQFHKVWNILNILLLYRNYFFKNGHSTSHCWQIKSPIQYLLEKGSIYIPEQFKEP